jgi:glycosyltransferase involved in cell wall biosynthesis
VAEISKAGAIGGSGKASQESRCRLIPLIVDLETEWRGGQSQALLLLKGLYERGHAAELVAAEHSTLGHRARKEGICVHSVSRGLFRLAAAVRIRSLLADGRIELVHVNEAHALTAAWLAGAHRKVPVVSSRRIGFPLQKNPLSRARYRSAQRFIANSNNVAQSLIDCGISPQRISVVNEGVEIPSPVQPAERIAARKKWNIAKDDFLFGCASAFVPEKGQQHAVEALAIVQKDFPGTRLLLAGEGRCRSEVQSLAAMLGLEGAVVIPGFVTNMREFYSALDAFVFPSEFEGLGTALQAAMVYALPVISTTRGALGEVVEHGRTALVAEPNAADFAAAMLRLLRDQTLRRQLSEAGHEEVRRRFSADRMVDNTLTVYEKVIS